LESLHQAFKKGLQDPDFINACTKGESVIAHRGPKEMAEHIRKLDANLKQILGDLKTKE
jgi:tripartite-type tricarboxylate transporter receptor subunit TctC